MASRFERSPSVVLLHKGRWFRWDPKTKRIQVSDDLDGKVFKTFPITDQMQHETDPVVLLDVFKNACVNWTKERGDG